MRGLACPCVQSGRLTIRPVSVGAAVDKGTTSKHLTYRGHENAGRKPSQTYSQQERVMQQLSKWSLLFLAVTALCAGGCAKHELVKEEPMIPAAASSAEAQPASQAAVAVAKPEVKDAGLSATAINEAQVAKQAQQEAAAQAAQEAVLKKADLEKVFFNFDSYTLSSEARSALTKNAEILKLKGNAKVRIEGNCDELGSDDYNLALGDRRAKAASSYLQSMGIAPARLSTISYGKEKPADPGHDESARAKNRRDEFVITSN
jgi:peptidoglycan-associated lipoprotein